MIVHVYLCFLDASYEIYLNVTVKVFSINLLSKNLNRKRCQILLHIKSVKSETYFQFNEFLIFFFFRNSPEKLKNHCKLFKLPDIKVGQLTRYWTNEIQLNSINFVCSVTQEIVLYTVLMYNN